MINAVKTGFFCAVVLTAGPVFAQVTLDLDVLTEDFLSQEIATPEEKKAVEAVIPLKAPETVVTPPVSSVSKTAVKPAKPVIKKPTVKKTPVKAAVKTPVKPKPAAKPKTPESKVKDNKFHITETGPRDAHDRLKPRANPVPEVKVLATEVMENISVPTENPAEKTRQEIEPKISKHYIINERLKSADNQPVAVEKVETAASKTPEISKDVRPVLAVEAVSVISKKQPVSDQKEKEKEQADDQPAVVAEKVAPVKFSVFYIPSRTPAAERSKLLAKEVPTESATVKALDKGLLLAHIFLFEENESALTEEMQTALNALAGVLHREQNKRVALYSYSMPDPTIFARERQLSLRRALMIRSYLASQGIRSLRIEIRSQGAKGAGAKIPNRTDILIEDK